MRRSRELLTAGIGILMLLATITAPLCGPLCAIANGCAAGMAPGGSQGSECHHAAMAREFSTSQIQFVSARLCASSELPAATLNPNKNRDELREMQTSATSPLRAASRTVQFPSLLGIGRARWLGSSGPSGTYENALQTLALRI